MTAPAFRPIHTLAADIAARRLSPVDLVDECLSRIERLEPKLHAFVSVNAANARLAAEAAHKAICFRACRRTSPRHSHRDQGPRGDRGRGGNGRQRGVETIARPRGPQP